ncbi:hypothetical protein [Halobacillus sp. Marseille-Q1614]|uniref:hypothetical protein n=1 Tax=Halobacillus sp. Marseille-Q1614 TaxID=2709134 RepID=UPI00156D6ADD|nr:hypothetical protein [Halobacillus sp. Marseille-Q1614]
MNVFSVFLISFLLLLVLLLLLDSAKNGITPTPSTRKERDATLLLAESLAPQTIADLGAGFGTMAFSFAGRFPDSTVTAYETAWVPWCFLHLRKLFQPRCNLIIKRRNFMDEDLRQYDLIFTYLYPKAMDLLEDKLDPRTSHVLSNTFALSRWKPSLIWPVESKVSYSSIYLYRRK